MATSTYSEKLKDPRWQKLRLKILERDGWECQFCGDEKNTLHVHHKRYFPGIEPWEYDRGHLLTLCEDCHQREYKCRDKVEQNLLDGLHALNWSCDEIIDLTLAILESAATPKELNRRIMGQEVVSG